MERNQFTFYRSFLEGIGKLQTNKEKLQAFETICRYGLQGNLPEEKEIKPAVATLFAFVKPVLDTAHKRAELAKKLSDRRQMENGVL